MFVTFWVLLSVLNNSTNTANLTPDDQEIFWVICCCNLLSVGGIIQGMQSTFELWLWLIRPI